MRGFPDFRMRTLIIQRLEAGFGPFHSTGYCGDSAPRAASESSSGSFGRGLLESGYHAGTGALPVASFQGIALSSLGNRGNSVTERRAHEQAARSGAGDAGPADPENPGTAAAAWLGAEPATETGFERGAAGERRLTLSGAAQAGATRVDSGGVEADREQSAGEVLLADAAGQAASGAGSGELGSTGGGDYKRDASDGGMIHGTLALGDFG